MLRRKRGSNSCLLYNFFLCRRWCVCPGFQVLAQIMYWRILPSKFGSLVGSKEARVFAMNVLEESIEGAHFEALNNYLSGRSSMTFRLSDNLVHFLILN